MPGTPTAWTPGTNGLVSGEVVLVTATTEEDLAQYKGKLKGKWVLVVAAPDVAAFWDCAGQSVTGPKISDAMELQPAPPALEFGVTADPGRGAPRRRRRRRQPGQRAAAPPEAAARGGQRAAQPPAAAPATPIAAAIRAADGERPRRLPARGRRTRHHHDDRDRPRDLHHRRQPQRRPRDDAAGRLHRRRTVRPHRPDTRAKNDPRRQLRPTSRAPTIPIPRCSTWSAKSPARTRPTKSCCSAPTSTLGTPPPARLTMASVWRR